MTSSKHPTHRPTGPDDLGADTPLPPKLNSLNSEPSAFHWNTSVLAQSCHIGASRTVSRAITRSERRAASREPNGGRGAMRGSPSKPGSP